MPKSKPSNPTISAVNSSDGLDIEKPQATGFDIFSEKWYDKNGDQGELTNTRPKKIVDEKECRALLRFAAEKVDAKTTRVAAERIKAELPNVFQMFKESSQPSAPQWADRTTGREVSPVDWVRMHYGSTREDGVWEANGLTRADLKSDPKLYQAYATWIRRHPEDNLGLHVNEIIPANSAEEALERRRASNRASYNRRTLKK